VGQFYVTLPVKARKNDVLPSKNPDITWQSTQSVPVTGKFVPRKGDSGLVQSRVTLSTGGTAKLV
jgi:hypothetical protein